MFPYLADDDFGVCFIQLMYSIRFFFNTFINVRVAVFICYNSWICIYEENGARHNTPITRGLWPEYLSLVTIVSISRLQRRGGMTPHSIKTNKAWTILKLATFVVSVTLNVFHIKTLRAMLNTTTVPMPTPSCLELHVPMALCLRIKMRTDSISHGPR